ncbi:MAG: hypothetical protein JWM53_2898 [bacterium]|nr:hypothetical protein [bacterium]
MNRLNRWLLRGAAFALALAALVAVGARPLARAWERRTRAQWHKQVLDAYQRMQHDDGSPALVLPERESGDDVDEDDATLRRLYTLAYYGNMATPDVSEQLINVRAREATRWAPLLGNTRGTAQANAAVTGQSWVNLGPTDARIQTNGGVYNGIDSGRAAAIRVDPRDKDVVYVATASGGVWKTYNFTAAQPSWSPMTDTIGGLAVGAFELDPNNPDTLYLGIGDALDTSIAGGAVYKSTDGGATWTMLTSRLSGAYPASAGSRTESAVAIRDIGIDRSNSSNVLISTDVGLFRSTDGGTTFALMPLPDPAGTVTLEQGTWTIAYLGAAGGKSAWVISGVDACATGQAPLGFGVDLPAGGATPTGGTCTPGTVGDVWRSADSGATWTSLRHAGKLPTTGTGSNDFGRMALAAGNPANGPDATVVYAQVANIDDANSTQIAVFKSTDGGKTFTSIATNATAVGDSNGNCANMDVAHGQAWYNLAVAVDPTNNNHVLLGGNYCGVRSIDGGTTWDNISHWLPGNGITLPYVHADWHAVTISNVGGALVAFAGSDGGVFSSSNVFSAAGGTTVAWNYTNNRGIATHLFYSIASGDPTIGDEKVVFGGLQDNGTRFRDLNVMLGKPTTFNQVIGGDGIGTALARSGANIAYWGSLPQPPGRLVCTTDPVTTCSQGAGWNNGPALANGTTDPDPFFMRYSTIEGDATGSLLTATTYRLWKLNYNGSTKTGLTTAATAANPSPLGGSIRNIYASPYTHTDCGAAGGQTCRLYGVALSGGKFAVVTDVAGTISTTTATVLVGDTASNQVMKQTTAIAFPSSAAHFLAGAHDGKVYIAGSTAPRLNDANNFEGTTVVPDAVGRLFLTTDAGTTYKPFHGNGTSDLPNVPVQAVVFDPSDTTDKTIFVGNDLGVYQTTDMGATWHRYGVGLPLVRVTDIRIAKNSGLMRVATFGRGLWEIYPNANAAPGVRGDGDWDRNLAIDFLDLGAMASRLGDTPATAAQPYYDWHLDVIGTVNSIAEDDLTALVGKFGSHP